MPGARSAPGRPTRTSRPKRRPTAEGRFRFPYLKIGPYAGEGPRQGFADSTRTLTADARLGLRPPDRAGGRGVDTSVTVTGEAAVLETARSQIAGTVPQAEVQSLPMNGRNFLDLALLIPGVSPTNIGSTQLFAETSAVPGPGHFDRQPAQPLEQLHRRRAVGQRRCGGTQRHPVRRRRRRAVSSRHVRRAGRARPRARRLRQRRHEERHQRAARHACTTSFATTTSTARTPCPARRCRWTSSSIGGSLGGPLVRESHVLLRELRAAAARSDRARHDPSGERRRSSTRRLTRSATRARRSRTGIYPNPVHSANVLGKIDHQFSGIRSVHRPLRLYRRHLGQLARRRRAERAERVGRARQRRSLARVRQHLDDLAEDRERNARAVRATAT